MRFNSQFARDLVDNVDSRGIAATLERADVGAVNPGSVGELLLRHSDCLPVSLDIGRNDLSDCHPLERLEL